VGSRSGLLLAGWVWASLLPAAACTSLPDAVPDGGQQADGPPPSPPQPPAGTVGSSSMIPMGKPASGPFMRAWQGLIRTGSVAKTVPQLADLDGDQHLDIVMNPRISNLIAWPGKGDGTFGQAQALVPTLIVNGWGLDTADFNGDGKIDVAIGDHNVMITARAFRNDGGFHFSDSSMGLPMVPMAKGLSGCGLGDFNGDGKIDYVAGSDQFWLTSGQLFMSFGDGKGGWTEVKPPGLGLTVSNVGHIFVADLNRDGDLDFVTAASKVGNNGKSWIYATAYLNQGKGTAWAPKDYGPYQVDSYQQQVSVADVNGDQILDLAVGGAILLGDGHGGFTEKAMTEPSAYNHFADMDGDGKMDLVTHDTKTGLNLWLGDGTGLSWKKAAVGLPAYNLGDQGEALGIAIGDLTGTGKLGIIQTYLTTVPSEQNFIEAWVR
jgi:hypothetical protein